MFIEDGTGSGQLVKINDHHQMLVVSENHPLQHHISRFFGQAYQVIGDHILASAGTKVILLLRNDSAEMNIAVTYIRLQAVDLAGGAALPSVNTKFEIGERIEFSSGGAVVTPSNMNLASGNEAEATAHDDNPTVTGTFDEFDRWYPSADEKMMVFNKEGAIILGLNDVIAIRFVTDHTSGTVYSRMSFVYIPRE